MTQKIEAHRGPSATKGRANAAKAERGGRSASIERYVTRPDLPLHIEAAVDVHFLAQERGGRKTPILNRDYMPMVRVKRKIIDPARLSFPGREKVMPGESVTGALLAFLSPRNYAVAYAPGTSFKLLEGSAVVGTGKFVKVLKIERL